MAPVPSDCDDRRDLHGSGVPGAARPRAYPGDRTRSAWAPLVYVERIGRTNITGYEQELPGYAMRVLKAVPGLVDTAPEKAAVLSFILDGYRPKDVGSALEAEGIAVRAGHDGPFGQTS